MGAHGQDGGPELGGSYGNGKQGAAPTGNVEALKNFGEWKPGRGGHTLSDARCLFLFYK